MNDIVAFTKVREPYGWLGNMAPYPVEHMRRMWPTTEHLFQGLRLAQSIPAQERVRSERSPLMAKRIAREEMERLGIVPMPEDSLRLMRNVLELKLLQHPRLINLLLDTGDAEIIEDVTKRRRGSALFWGAALQSNGQWVGENHLGKIWMELRRLMRIGRQ